MFCVQVCVCVCFYVCTVYIYIYTYIYIYSLLSAYVQPCSFCRPPFKRVKTRRTRQGAVSLVWCLCGGEEFPCQDSDATLLRWEQHVFFEKTSLVKTQMPLYWGENSMFSFALFTNECCCKGVLLSSLEMRLFDVEPNADCLGVSSRHILAL